jgi:hypothetical protein
MSAPTKGGPRGCKGSAARSNHQARILRTMKTLKAKTKAASSELPELRAGGHSVPHTGQTFSEQSPAQYMPVPAITCPADAESDTHKQSSMLAKSNLTFLITNSFHSDVIARRLIGLADGAYFNRRHDELESISEALSCIQRYNSIAAYYQGIVAQARKDYASASEHFRLTFDSAPPEYKARALVSLGATDLLQGGLNAYYYSLALRRSNTSIATRFIAAEGIAQIYALSGQHDRAIEQFESLYPVAKHLSRINPRLYYDVLNSLAVEYCETGSIEAARRAITAVKDSFLFHTIKEYQETEREIQGRESRPAMVAVSVPTATRKVITAMCLLFLSGQRQPSGQSLIPRTNPTPNVSSRIVRCTPVHGPPFFRK